MSDIKSKSFRILQERDLLQSDDFVEINGCIVDANQWLIFWDDKIIIPDVEHHIKMVFRDHPYINANYFKSGDDIELAYDIQSSHANTFEIQKALYIGGSYQYYHNTINYLSRLFYVHRHIPRDYTLLVEGIARHNWEGARAFLKSSPRPTLIMEKPMCVFVERLAICRSPFNATGKGMNADFPSWISSVLGLAQKHKKSERRLYLSRRECGSRNVANESEITAMLSQFGFEMIIPEQLTVAQQIETFSEARVIVGPTGSAFTNIIYCNPGSYIIEFMPMRTWKPQQIRYLADFFKHKYQFIPIDAEFGCATMTVDKDYLYSALETLA